MKRMSLLILSILMVSATLFAGGAQESTFPDPEKTITVVCPHAAGGSTDMIFRTLVEQMKKISGQNIIVTNVTGAGSATGTNEVLNQPADGYTFLGAGTHTIAATMQGLTEGYKDMDFVAGLNLDPFVIAVRNDKPWTTFEELVADARKNPGKITFGNAGMGGATGVACVGINLAFDKSFNVTPFNGGADLISSVLGGHCDVGVFSQSEVVANIDSFRPLVILSPDRSAIELLKNVPTLAEAGYPDIKVPGGSYRSVMVKAGTPEDAKLWLADIIEKAFNTEEFQSFMAKNGIIPQFTKLEDSKKAIDEYIAQYEPILKEAGLYKLD